MTAARKTELLDHHKRRTSVENLQELTVIGIQFRISRKQQGITWCDLFSWNYWVQKKKLLANRC